MQNHRLILAYDGTRYKGWQSQGNTDNTVQGRVEATLSRLTGEPVDLHGSGRTDAGVHAAAQVASFTLERPVPCDRLLADLNRCLPADIGALDLRPAPVRFHPRLSAVGKTYVYRIWNSPLPDVFGRRYRLSIAQPLNLEAMKTAAALLEGCHDFRSFCGLARFKKSTVRTLFSIEITANEAEVSLRFTADGFLNRMVRILSGTLVEVGLGLRPPEEMTRVLAARDRSASAGALSPHGLMLEQVYYDCLPAGHQKRQDCLP